jgi:glycosyltransferase involved in cell wall biosynthesis
MKLVSVWMIAYNQEQYIGQAIESIVTQKVNFDFEVVIGEDCSPDNTRKICEEYAQKYPELIRLLPSDRNYGSLPNTLRTLEACTGSILPPAKAMITGLMILNCSSR